MAKSRWEGSTWAVAGLVALGVVTAATAGLALTQHRPVAASPAPSAQPTVSVPAPTDPVVSPSATVPETTPSPSPSPSASPSATVPDNPLAAAISPDGASLLVLGDGTGNEPDEWVHVWAADHLGADRSVDYVLWDRGAESFVEAEELSSTGPVLTVYNGSTRSPSLSAEPARAAKAFDGQDLVLLSYGHRKYAGDLTPALTKMLAEIRKESATVPVAVVLQNPDPAASAAQQKATVEAVAEWAAENDLPTIDVFGGFPESQSKVDALVEEDGSPNKEGSKLFAELVAAAFA
ncbi:hypothetical protein [Tessaracoccus defluvii]|uniref:SGNH/GDSL hydrolase family protein n=1 Tax=Tessaracoccus defluvii TaxID=1285901 RepID=A0A7H0H3C0_9ACTN|nr:hypothetical protein [Tessaracoccus defluvii]QNP55036.1 hypothetical protein H9L22_12230 [Tessaracoccus defluvii]